MRFQDSEDEQFQTVVALPPAKRVKLQQPIKEEAANQEIEEEFEEESDYSTASDDDSDQTDSDSD